MHWYFDVLQKYVVFSGRARRREYWTFVLVNTIVAIALQVLEGALGLFPQTPFYVLLTLYSVAVFLPSWGVAVRRLHDGGNSGWTLLVGLVPLIGAIAILVMLFQNSQPGENKYGPNPKGTLADKRNAEEVPAA